MDSKNWINDIREIKKYNSEILSLKNGHWQVKDKITILEKYASFFYDSHLDSIKTISIKVLSEMHPMFDLKPEDRFAATIHGKIPKYSSELRKGICETLTFLGVHGDKLTNCTQHKPENIVNITIRELFNDANWKLWASLNDIMPILAEAAPTEFFETVENALKQSPCPFDELYNQEGIGGIMGANYMTGLYWALETLAWSEEYLSRAILILAELATHDPGGTWANRPSNSISTILLPWLPQTMATVDKKIAALKGIQRNFPDISWEVLIKLLPNQHQTSSGSHKPSYREYIPEDWKKEVSTTEYWEEVRGYASIAVDMAKGNVSYVSQLVDNLDNVPQPSFDSFLEYLSSDNIIKLPDEQKQPIWETLTALIRKHRSFADAKWALPLEMVDALEQTANKISPSSPKFLHRPLFSDRDYDFFDRGIDWTEQQEILLKQRVEALKQIYEINKTDSVINFAEHVENPRKVGNAFAQIANNKNDNELLPSFLNSQEQNKKQFISGYILARYHKEGLNWIDSLNIEAWSIKQKCSLFFNVPFEKEIWDKAIELLGGKVENYWKGVNANPFSTQSNLLPAIEKLLQNGRPRLALDCIYAHYFLKKEFFKEQAIKALIDGSSSDEHTGTMDVYHVTEIIKMLQNDSEISENDLLEIEWAYLPLLDRHNNSEPKLLEKYLSQKPELFIEVIKLIYRSTKDTNKKEMNETKKQIATNAWKLLHEWRRPPGKLDNGSFSGEALCEWFTEVKANTIESGHFEVAMTHLGHVLFYSGPDPNGLWIHQSVAELLDDKDNDQVRQGFSSEVFNSRGIYSIDPSGKPEKKLAELWRKNAEEVENIGLIHFASLLKELAKSYDREAERVISDFSKEQNEENE